ncbi:nucleoredoxin-like protein 2 [Gigantopelta aegis]|uniref:nucleoredoxin-like protein 2 n=1 Tax=Gigantopelta aegis TaxID=1735272 RepID=UPI001B887884|nr:nucleoredoxin-like protein 2 [Gigantopelta aegis]XP_041358646.1 nucleoredoxin-like protein 2 [Gigantopelta aegis]XP_041358647.1 nucleoredoxin-like protein 2 [Gigantopelta aegis]
MSELLAGIQLLKQSYFSPSSNASEPVSKTVTGEANQDQVVEHASDSGTKTITGGEALQDKVVEHASDPASNTVTGEALQDKVVEHASDPASNTVTGEALQDKVVALYFSASWCPPCRQFTPMLCELFAEAQNRHLPFQVVFVSLDREHEDMEKYFIEKHGDWLLIPFDDPAQESLINKYSIRNIPKLVVIRSNGEVITMNGRKDVQDKGIVCLRNWLSLANIQEDHSQDKQTEKDTSAPASGN